MIRYCCYYCKKLNTDKCLGSCYNALGGKEHHQYCLDNGICTTKDGACAESFNMEGGKRIPAIEANNECWEEQDEPRQD